ncbi:Ankyrin repeat-containing domain [Pseudocohnilembus persalinus]|uniref:Ankyrin repeat-containing domain n=1 Tax=Pseudocohnilembus persalinus TaxID=266149 RepID=A0A0V0QEI2_PSEPJ|nr:Ankyrin repeat-containing domain [Pseudocohnilembus persalinus]|eukprot:KRX00575.1 Ankyrin repeat-containing domain [Pseudocohnilembus persalinus]
MDFYYQDDLQTIIIDPYSILMVKECNKENENFQQQCTMNFQKIVKNEKLSYYKRKNASLALQAFIKPEMYKIQKQENNKYECQFKPNIFHYVSYCDFKNLVPNLQDNIEKKLELKDKKGYGLLHLATLPGFKIMILYLLQKGININQLNDFGSTPLHIACYNGHLSCVDILLLNGANMDIKNNGEHLAIDANYQLKNQISDLFQKYKILRENNLVYKKIAELRQKQLISVAYTLNSKDGQDIGIFVQPNYNSNEAQKKKLIYTMQYPNMVNTVYHGTKIQYIEDILKKGLLKPSERGQTKLDSNKFQLNKIYNGVENWADAIFVSGSPYYASQKIYSEYIDVNYSTPNKEVKQQYCVILQCAMRLNSPCEDDVYTGWKHTLSKYELVPNENEIVEFRVIDSKKIVVTGIYFFDLKYMQTLDDWEQVTKILNEKAKIDGIYCNNNNTHKVNIQKYWDLCLMGHKLEINQSIEYECDICGQKSPQNSHCDKCNFTRCQFCQRQRLLL